MRSILIASVAILSLGLVACGKTTDTAAAKETKVALPAYNEHAVDVFAATCITKQDCTVVLQFKEKPRASSLYGGYIAPERREFSRTCYKDSDTCYCYRDEFCSAAVVLRLNGKDYTGFILKPYGDDATYGASLVLTDTRDIADQLTGDGEIYGVHEAVPAVATSAVKAMAQKKTN